MNCCYTATPPHIVSLTLANMTSTPLVVDRVGVKVQGGSGRLEEKWVWRERRVPGLNCWCAQNRLRHYSP